MTSEPRSETPEALLDAAEALFSEKGYASVTTREIVDRAGVNIAAINYHFGSKSELYLATVRRAMSRGERDSAWATLRDFEGTREEAAVVLAHFVAGYLGHLVESESGPGCGQLMFWEAIQPSEAIDAVVRDYVRPGHEALVALVLQLMPGADRARATLVVRSILGQLLHYKIFRPFIDRLEGSAAFRPQSVEQAARHITRFSLRGMGFDDGEIEQIFDAAGSLAAVEENGS